MYTIVLRVDAPLGQAIGIKEDAAMFFEKYGDTKVISIEEITPEQVHLGGR